FEFGLHFSRWGSHSVAPGGTGGGGAFRGVLCAYRRELVAVCGAVADTGPEHVGLPCRTRLGRARLQRHPFLHDTRNAGSVCTVAGEPGAGAAGADLDQPHRRGPAHGLRAQVSRGLWMDASGQAGRAAQGSYSSKPGSCLIPGMKARTTREMPKLIRMARIMSQLL